MGLEQLAFLAAQPCPFALSLGYLLIGGLGDGADMGLDCLSDARLPLLGEAHHGIVFLHGSLDGSRSVIGLGTVALHPATANEIVIAAAVAFGLHVDQA